VRTAVAAKLRSEDPGACRRLRRSAWRQLRSEVRSAGLAELWRYTADLLFLIEHPLIRSAFFPSEAHPLAVEPARHQDGAAIAAIAEQWEGPEACALLTAWWREAPDAFHVARALPGGVAGFYCLLSRKQAACSGQRPSGTCVRRVYTAIRDRSVWSAALAELGFRFLDERAEIDGAIHHLALLDFGPASVDGWLAGLAGRELGIEEGGVLDVTARTLRVGSARVPLTRLEFELLHFLLQREGEAVTREVLLREDWGHRSAASSNIVDTVIRALRKKLGAKASLLETVRGVGYRRRAGAGPRAPNLGRVAKGRAAAPRLV
jgi:hypothetical protein